MAKTAQSEALQSFFPPATHGSALVTGGARRIGAAICRTLAHAGYAVAIHVRHAGEDSAALRDDIVSHGGRAVVIEADLAQADHVQRLIADATTAIGLASGRDTDRDPLSVLVNNASVFEHDEAEIIEPEKFDRHMAINARAPLLLAQAFAAQEFSPQATAAGLVSIINIVDQRVAKPTPAFFSYALSKHALNVATMMLAQRLAPAIRVNAVAPGPTLPSPRQTAEDFARQAAALPLQRGPSAADIADAVLYLVRARAVTGQTVMVDGGQHTAWRTPDTDGIRE
ncbi:MAG TPA: SDR family oxidoreductase [Xanthobacteraceae bacterium]|jgi:NAD(P)-dependent dehydrogenase (short-subunit alcohol dehydrogenase family)|nr:SDR family oxidoreductase [Xanthobacteraceae bacterium]